MKENNYRNRHYSIKVAVHLSQYLSRLLTDAISSKPNRNDLLQQTVQLPLNTVALIGYHQATHVVTDHSCNLMDLPNFEFRTVH